MGVGEWEEITKGSTDRDNVAWKQEGADLLLFPGPAPSTYGLSLGPCVSLVSGPALPLPRGLPQPSSVRPQGSFLCPPGTGPVALPAAQASAHLLLPLLTGLLPDEATLSKAGAGSYSQPRVAHSSSHKISRYSKNIPFY